jgi:hypothetical protein
MWCQKCQADVAGIASPDNERALCTTCGNEIARSAQSQSVATQPGASPPIQPQTVQPQSVQATSAPLPSDPLRPDQSRANASRADQEIVAPSETARSLRDPRELLARWAREDALNPLEFAVAREPASESRKSLNRFDSSHSIPAPRPATFVESARAGMPVLPTIPVPELPSASGHDNIIHRAHAPNPPHIQTAPVAMADKSSKWVMLVGQIFAYLGVGGLTVGTSLVLMGYFGGPASYAPTGWLVTTAGQMLLFLGVVTLVSGGMEQTTQEVARRIDTLGERLVRIEQATERAETRK